MGVLRRWFLAAAAALLAAGLAGGAHVWNRNFRAPPVEPLPLPAALIALDSPDGQRLLAEPGFKTIRSTNEAWRVHGEKTRRDRCL